MEMFSLANEAKRVSNVHFISGALSDIGMRTGRHNFTQFLLNS
jgi:hypothetical protein